MLSRETNRHIYFECDGKRCSEIIETETSDFHEAREQLQAARWVTRKGAADAWEHFCPEHARP